jgi:hypothetical protein
VHEVRTRLQHRQSEAPCSIGIPGDASGGHGGEGDDAGADLTLGTARYRLLVGDALDFLRSYAFTGSELVYYDPPYVRRSRRTRARLYRYEMDDRQHADLLAILRRLPCAVMVSGYRSALYGEMLGDWRTTQFQAMTRGGPATEVVWMNYPAPTDLHEYTYRGDNYREREKPKRLHKRWIKKLVAKPQLEQKALLIAQLESVGPTVSAAVMRSVHDHFGDEALIVSKGTGGSAHAPRDGTAVSPARASRCTLCRHPDRLRIDQALAAGASVRAIARREGLSKSVVGRHLDHGLSRAVSHLRTSQSGTADTGHQRGQTTRSEQFDLLALDTVG